MRRRTLIIAVLLVAAAGGGAYSWRGRSAGGAAQAADVTQAAAERGPFRVAVVASGRVVPNLEVEIKAKASGQIVKLPKDVSHPVKSGDLLVELDPVDEERSVKQAKASLEGSEARLVQAERGLEVATRNLATSRKEAQADLASAEVREKEAVAKVEREKELLERRLSTPEVYDAARTAVAQAQADLARARVRVEVLETEELALELKRQDVRLAGADVERDTIALAMAERRLAETKVVAPIDGVVSTRTVQVGQIISSAVSNVGGGTPMLSIADLSRVFVLASVDESEIGKVEVGQSAVVTFDARPGVRLAGEVALIATKGTVVSNVVTFEVKVEVLDRRKSLLKPEMTAQVEIVIDEKEDALTVPADAVVRRGRGKSFVRVPKAGGGGEEEREVKVGMSDGLRTEIVEGLAAGDKVIVKKDDADSRWRGGGQRGAGGQQRLGFPGGPGGPGGRGGRGGR